MSKFKVLVEVVIEVDDDHDDHPLFGVKVVADDYAKMAIRYGAIGATSSKVVAIDKVIDESHNA